MTNPVVNTTYTNQDRTETSNSKAHYAIVLQIICTLDILGISYQGPMSEEFYDRVTGGISQTQRLLNKQREAHRHTRNSTWS